MKDMANMMKTLIILAIPVPQLPKSALKTWHQTFMNLSSSLKTMNRFSR